MYDNIYNMDDQYLEMDPTPQSQRRELILATMGLQRMLADTRKGWTYKRINNTVQRIVGYKFELFALLDKDKKEKPCFLKNEYISCINDLHKHEVWISDIPKYLNIVFPELKQRQSHELVNYWLENYYERN